MNLLHLVNKPVVHKIREKLGSGIQVDWVTGASVSRSRRQSHSSPVLARASPLFRAGCSPVSPVVACPAHGPRHSQDASRSRPFSKPSQCRPSRQPCSPARVVGNASTEFARQVGGTATSRHVPGSHVCLADTLGPTQVAVIQPSVGAGDEDKWGQRGVHSVQKRSRVRARLQWGKAHVHKVNEDE